MFNKEFIVILERNRVENYWSMYIIQNIANLFNNDLIPGKVESNFGVYYLRSAKIIFNRNAQEFSRIVTENAKVFIQNLFNLVFENENFNNSLEDSNFFTKNEFETKLIELGQNKNLNSGVTIAGALQELIDYVFMEDTQIDNINFNKVTTDDYILNLRDVIYNKMFSYYTNKKKEERTINPFSLERKTKFKEEKAFDVLNTIKNSIDKKNDQDVSTKIVSRDSRKVMNQVLNEMFGGGEDKSIFIL